MTDSSMIGSGGPRPGRVIGIDPGTVRLGIAITDPDRMLATPHSTIDGGKGAVGRVASLVAQVGAVEVVVGLPRSLGGGDTDSTRMARSLADDLAATGLTVHLHDERLTSVQADRALRSAGRSSKKDRHKGLKDQIAASVVLQAWLDSADARQQR